MASPEALVTEPVAIYKLAHRYLLYDPNVVTYLRQKHNISGVLIGSLPQASQQNVFLGLPLELMPEEARLLVDQGVAHVVDDVAAHKHGFLGAGLGAEERKAYQSALRRQGQGAAREASKRSDDRKQAALKKQQQRRGGTENWNDIPDDMFATPAAAAADRRAPRKASGQREAVGAGPDTDDLLFGGAASSAPPKAARPRVYAEPAADAYSITPTTSYPPLSRGPPPPAPPAGRSLSQNIEVPKSYPFYKHLHAAGYFLAPGLRFGCQMMAYPGDPLRFHSHFLCNGMAWDEEFDLIDVVGGGRLGTGVKKAFLIGGEERLQPRAEPESSEVRAFSIEWAGI